MILVSDYISFTTNQPDNDQSVIDAYFQFRRVGNSMEIVVCRIYPNEPDSSHQLDVPNGYDFGFDLGVHTEVEEFTNPYDLKTYYKKTTKRKKEVVGWSA